MVSDFAKKFGCVRTGYGFECEKNNGKKYSGEIVRVAAYNKGTMVTIRFYDNGSQYRNIYLEDCSVWHSEETCVI